MALTGANNEEKIWNFLYSHIKNAYGTAGLMGNLYAESALRPNNLQDVFEKKLGYTDESYTNAVDSGRYSGFVRDSAGYGLAQWTFWSRKQAMYNFVKGKGKSIADLETQLEFLIEELKSLYPTVWEKLLKATSVKTASNVVLTEYEAPGNQSDGVKTTRANYGQTYFDRYTHAKEQQVIESNKKQVDFYKVSPYAKYLVTTGGHLISNSGGDERGKISGGKAGDQTGNEWVLRYWYNRPWSCVLRYPDAKVGMKIAELGCEAALNDKIGYDQNERYTYWDLLQKAGYHPSKITQACEADCSAGVIANVRGVGYLLNIAALKNISATYTGNMRAIFALAGFQVLTDSKYLTSAKYLLPGDILLNDLHHTCTNVSVGSAMLNTTVPVTPGTIATINDGTLKIGMQGTEVELMQKMLQNLGYDIGSYGVDGDFGKDTLYALRAFQKDQNLIVDGIYGPQSRAALTKAYNKKAPTSTSPTSKGAYMVKVTADSLNIRSGPSTQYEAVGKITDGGVYTIVDKVGTWGKLKSGAGWISLNYTRKV